MASGLIRRRSSDPFHAIPIPGTVNQEPTRHGRVGSPRGFLRSNWSSCRDRLGARNRPENRASRSMCRRHATYEFGFKFRNAVASDILVKSSSSLVDGETRFGRVGLDRRDGSAACQGADIDSMRATGRPERRQGCAGRTSNAGMEAIVTTRKRAGWLAGGIGLSVLWLAAPDGRAQSNQPPPPQVESRARLGRLTRCRSRIAGRSGSRRRTSSPRRRHRRRSSPRRSARSTWRRPSAWRTCRTPS